MGIGPQSFERFEVTGWPFFLDPTGATDNSAKWAAGLAELQNAGAPGPEVVFPKDGRSNSRYYFASQPDFNLVATYRAGGGHSSGYFINAVSLEFANGVSGPRQSAGGSRYRGLTFKHRDYQGNIHQAPHRQWRPSRVTALGEIRLPTFAPSGPTGIHWGWGAKCVTAGTTGTSEGHWATPATCLWRDMVYNPKNSIEFTADDGTDTFSAVVGGAPTVNPFTNGWPVQAYNTGGALPAGLAVSTVYYVVNVIGATFQLSATRGGAAINITTNGTGTNWVKTGLPTVTDGSVVWQPVMVNGLEITAFCSMDPDNLFIGWPSNAIELHCSQGYVPSVNANRTYIRGVTMVYGNNGFFRHGSDVGVGCFDDANVLSNRGVGVEDPGSTNFDYRGLHFAVNEIGDMRLNTSRASGTYHEAGYSGVLVRQNAVWDYGTSPTFWSRNGVVNGLSFTGILAPDEPALSFWQPDTAYAANDVVKPPASSRGDGYLYKIRDAVLSFPSGAGTSVAAVTYTASDSGGDLLLTKVAHGRAVGDQLVMTNTGGTFPPGLSANLTFHIVSTPSADTFKVSLTAGGTPVAWTSAGTGTNKYALQPLWNTSFPIFGPGTSEAADLYGECTDGTCIWGAYQLSEGSSGRIELSTFGYNRRFQNRISGEAFYAGGAALGDYFAFGSNGTAEWAFNRPTDTGDVSILRQGASNKVAMVLGDGTTTLPDGRAGFPQGAYIGGSSSYARFFTSTTKPANGSEAPGSFCTHSDAAVGEPMFWTAEADGTWSDGNLRT